MSSRIQPPKPRSRNVTAPPPRRGFAQVVDKKKQIVEQLKVIAKSQKQTTLMKITGSMAGDPSCDSCDMTMEDTNTYMSFSMCASNISKVDSEDSERPSRRVKVLRPP